MKPTKYLLEKIQDLMKEVGYVVRYEKGNFQSGYCIVESRNIAVINKFYDTEARISCILDILRDKNVDAEALGDKSKKLYKQLKALSFELPIENKIT